MRYRTVGDMTCTGAVRVARARPLPDVVSEIAATRITERGETRADDRVTEAAMEDQAARVTSNRAGSQLMTPGAATNGHAIRTRTSELLRFATAGSVDDGKSTLIGRLLHDSKAIFEDQLEGVRADLSSGAATRLAVTWPCC